MTKRQRPSAVAYFRTSSATNVGDDKDSIRRQQEAVRSYAKRHAIEIVEEFYDAAVSGADAIDERPGFSILLGRVRQVLGAISQFEKAQLVAKLKVARDRKSEQAGRRIEGRKPVPDAVKKAARRLARKSPKTGKRRSFRQISAALAEVGHLGPSGKPYGAESV